MKSKIRVTVEFVNVDEDGTERIVQMSAEQSVAQQLLERIDDCESNLLDVGYEAMRQGMDVQFKELSKKNADPKQEDMG